MMVYAALCQRARERDALAPTQAMVKAAERQRFEMKSPYDARRGDVT